MMFNVHGIIMNNKMSTSYEIYSFPQICVINDLIFFWNLIQIKIFKFKILMISYTNMNTPVGYKIEFRIIYSKSFSK